MQAVTCDVFDVVVDDDDDDDDDDGDENDADIDSINLSTLIISDKKLASHNKLKPSTSTRILHDAASLYVAVTEMQARQASDSAALSLPQDNNTHES